MLGASVAGPRPCEALDTRRRLGLMLLGGRARAGCLGSWRRGRRRGLIGLALGAWLAAVGGSRLGWADEASVEDRPISEACEQPHWLERAFDERLRKKTLFPRLKDVLSSQSPFLRDSELLAHVRTYYLLRDNADAPDNEAWAAGGWLRYRSGWLADTLQIGATAYALQARQLLRHMLVGRIAFTALDDGMTAFVGHGSIGPLIAGTVLGDLSKTVVSPKRRKPLSVSR